MANGNYTGNYTYSQTNLSESELVCGPQAREQALNAKRRLLPHFESLTKRWKAFINQIEPLLELHVIASVASLENPLLELNQHTKNLLSLKTRLKKLRASPSLKKLYEDHKSCEALIESHEKNKAKLERKLGASCKEEQIWCDVRTSAKLN